MFLGALDCSTATGQETEGDQRTLAWNSFAVILNSMGNGQLMEANASAFLSHRLPDVPRFTCAAAGIRIAVARPRPMAQRLHISWSENTHFSQRTSRPLLFVNFYLFTSSQMLFNSRNRQSFQQQLWRSRQFRSLFKWVLVNAHEPRDLVVQKRGHLRPLVQGIVSCFLKTASHYQLT